MNEAEIKTEPDFEKLAGKLAEILTAAKGYVAPSDVEVARYYLVAVWNARGAADLDAIHAVGGELHGREYEAIRKLDH